MERQFGTAGQVGRAEDGRERQAQLAEAIAEIERGLDRLDRLGLSNAAAHVSHGLELARNSGSFEGEEAS